MEDARRAEEEADRFARASMLGERLRPLWDSDRIGAWEAPGTRKDMPIDFCWPAHTWGYTMVDVVRTILKDECKRQKVEWETARKPEFLKTGKRVAYIEGYKLWFQSARASVDTIENQLLALTRNSDNGKTSRSQPYVTMTDAAVARSASDAFGTWLELTKKDNAAKMLRASEAAAAEAAAASAAAAAAAAAAAGPSTSSAVVPPSAAQVVAPAVAADEADEAAPAVPLPPENRYAVLQPFLRDPTQWHTFAPEPSLRDAVAKCMDENHMFAVSMLSETTGMPLFEKLESTCEVVPQQDVDDETGYEFGNFLRDHGFDELLLSQASRDDPKNRAYWPRTFATLDLEFVAQGTYNSVWAPKPGLDYSDTLFPWEVTDALTGNDAVLRAQVPREGNRDLLNYEDALAQMTNMADASAGGYGPLIFAMGWQVVEVRFSPGGPRAKGYRLYAFLERGSMDVDARVSKIDRTWARPPLDHYLNNLLVAVWGYSTQRFVFVDGKLQNFIDTYPEGSARLELGAVGAIRVIDLDASGFRSLRRADDSPDAVRAQGWRLTWMHNVLVISSLLRLHLPYEIYRDLWWNKVHGAVLRLRVELNDPRRYKDDPEYTHVASFVNACRWHGPLRPGRLDGRTGAYEAQLMSPPHEGTAPTDVAAECRKFAAYYFHDNWHQWGFQNYAAVVVKQLKVHANPMSTPTDMARALDRRTRAMRDYDEFYRPKVIPMHRHFAEALGREPQDAPMLVHVMYDYCSMPEAERLGRYLDGAPTGRLQRVWPRVKRAQEHVTVQLHQAIDPMYWERELGFR